MRKGFLLFGIGLIFCGSAPAFAQQSGGVWGQSQGIWSNNNSKLWGSNSSVWSSSGGSRPTKGSGGKGQQANVPHALMNMSSPDEDRIARNQMLTRLAQKAAGIDPDNPGAASVAPGSVSMMTPGYVDQFGISHAGSVVIDGKKMLAVPNNPNDTPRNYGVSIPTPARAAGDGSPTGGAVTGTFITSPSQQHEDAMMEAVRRNSTVAGDQ